MITTADFSKAIDGFYSCREAEVRDWCEQGILKARRNPSPRLTRPKWRIAADGVENFLRNHLDFEEHEVKEVLKRLRINFKQLFLRVA